MGLFDFVKENANAVKMEAEQAYHEAMNEGSPFASEEERNQVCFERALDSFQEASEKSKTAKMTGYLKAIYALYKSNGVRDAEPFLENQWYRLKHYKYYQALSVYEKLLAKDCHIEKDSAGRSVWR